MMADQPTVPFPAVPQPPDRRRAGWHAALIAALVVLVLTLPLAVYLIMRAGDDQAGGPALAPPPASGSPSTGGPSTGSPAAPPPATRPPSSAPRPPDGHIGMAELRNATLWIPPWPADNLQGPSGWLHFTDGVVPVEQPPPSSAPQPATGMEIVIVSVAHGDVDRDGADETVAEIGCLIEGGSKQLVALDRDTRGRIVTMGTVVATTGPVRDIGDDSTRITAGTVSVRVADYQVCCGDTTPQTWQRRGYRWLHGRFVQVSGPTEMTVSPYVTETVLSTGDLVLGPVIGGYRYGTLTVTTRHRWGAQPARLAIDFYPSAGLERAGTAWPPISATPHSPWFQVIVAAPPASGSAVHTFAFRRPAGVSADTLDLSLGALNRSGTLVSEAIGWNNGATAEIRAVD